MYYDQLCAISYGNFSLYILCFNVITRIQRAGMLEFYWAPHILEMPLKKVQKYVCHYLSWQPAAAMQS